MKYLITIGSAAAIYILLIIGLRLLGKKELSQLTITDLVFVMLLGNAVQNSMIGPDDNFLSGVLAALTLMVLNNVFKNILYRSDRVSRIMEGEPSVLIRNGQVNEERLRKNKIARRDLEQICRENGYKDISGVELAILEVDGKVSFLKTSGEDK